MKKLMFFLILLSIAVTIPISGEEVTLTTIVPDQTILRGRQGAVGEAYRSYLATSIPANGLIVEGNVGIGTGPTIPQQKLSINSGGTSAIGIVDGNQASGRVLTSDANGAGTWQDPGGARIYSAVGTTDISATTAWTDMPDMSISQNLTPGKIFILFNTTITASPRNDEYVGIQILVNGIVKMATKEWGPDNDHINQVFPTTLMWVEDIPITGSYTITVQWVRSSGILIGQPGTLYKRVLTVIKGL